MADPIVEMFLEIKSFGTYCREVAQKPHAAFGGVTSFHAACSFWLKWSGMHSLAIPAMWGGIQGSSAGSFAQALYLLLSSASCIH
jgi:hypothetical protein